MRAASHVLKAVSAITLGLFISANPVSAASKVAVDKNEFNAGKIMEGSMQRVKHAFILTNTGNEPLHIKEVKPG
jgi:hypothetical protein